MPRPVPGTGVRILGAECKGREPLEELQMAFGRWSLVGGLEPDIAGEWLRVHPVEVPIQHAHGEWGEPAACRASSRGPGRVLPWLAEEKSEPGPDVPPVRRSGPRQKSFVPISPVIDPRLLPFLAVGIP